MTPLELLDSLSIRGIALRVAGGTLLAKPMAARTLDDRELIRQHKDGLVELLQAGGVLTQPERQSLMDATAEQCHQRYTDGDIDWPVVDPINDRIGRTFTRRELVTLLTEYETAILRGGANQ